MCGTPSFLLRLFACVVVTSRPGAGCPGSPDKLLSISSMLRQLGHSVTFYPVVRRSAETAAFQPSRPSPFVRTQHSHSPLYRPVSDRFDSLRTRVRRAVSSVRRLRRSRQPVLRTRVFAARSSSKEGYQVLKLGAACNGKTRASRLVPQLNEFTTTAGLDV